MASNKPAREIVMNILIIKLGATGDVVRTTTLLRRMSGRVTWLTAAKNADLLQNQGENLRCVSWEQREAIRGARFDLAVNLEDDLETAQFLNLLQCKQLFGAYVGSNNIVRYTDDSSSWFDLSLISVHGKEEADRLKLQNRQTYQEHIFGGLGLTFEGERYVLPKPPATGLSGDVAIGAMAGPVWPMKNWAYYDELKQGLEANGLVVNFLPQRHSLLEHLGDVQGHRCLVSGDSLPMHFALGTDTPCVSIFTCTSPWEIYDYGLQTKIVSPFLEEYFYKRGYERRATTAISVDEVFAAVINQLKSIDNALSTQCGQ
jgi:ADP-heptose:LPS heptosyltransferase